MLMKMNKEAYLKCPIKMNIYFKDSSKFMVSWWGRYEYFNN